jgi:hypothetical protein
MFFVGRLIHTAGNRHKQNSQFCKEIREDKFRFWWRRVHKDASQGMYMSKIEICFFTHDNYVVYCSCRYADPHNIVLVCKQVLLIIERRGQPKLYNLCLIFLSCEIREDNFRFWWRRVHEDASQGMYMSKIEICFFTARILQNQRMLCCGECFQIYFNCVIYPFYETIYMRLGT